MARNRYGLSTDPRVQREQKEIVHDAAIFAVKLWVDGLKDIVLAFLCVGAAVVDLVRGRGPQGYLFYRVMRFSKRVDAAVNLYGTPKRQADDVVEDDPITRI